VRRRQGQRQPHRGEGWFKPAIPRSGVMVASVVHVVGCRDENRVA
jgi:hypothetical protein